MKKTSRVGALCSASRRIKYWTELRSLPSRFRRPIEVRAFEALRSAEVFHAAIQEEDLKCQNHWTESQKK